MKKPILTIITLTGLLAAGVSAIPIKGNPAPALEASPAPESASALGSDPALEAAPGVGAAAASTGETAVTLDSCRRMALGNNKGLRVSSMNLESARYREKAAKGLYLPALDFNGGYMLNSQEIELLAEDAKLPTMSFDPKTGGYQYNILTDAQGMPVKDPATGSYIPTQVAVIPKEAMSYNTHQVFFGSFTLTQPVFLGGQIRALNEMTKYGREAAEALYDQQQQDLVCSVDEAYWRVVSLKAKKELAESFVQLVDTLKYNVEAMEREGVATKSDVLTVEVKYNEAQIMLTKVDNGLTLSRMALAQLCGLAVNTPMRLQDEGIGPAGADGRVPDYTYNMQDVYQSRADLRAVDKGIKLFESKEKLAMGLMLPKVAVAGAYSFSNPNVNHGFKRSFGGGFSVGATLSVPLWHWGTNYNTYRAAKSQTAATRLLLDDLEEKVDLQVNQAKFSFQEAFKTLDMTKTNMRKADENLRQARIGFQEGVMTTNDVIGAQTAWLQAHSELIDAQIGVELCETYLSKALGQLNVK